MIIGVEGNIGAGKSTLLENIAKQYPGVCVIPEDISSWNKYVVDGKPLLEAFYDNPREHGFKTQMAILLSRHKANVHASMSSQNVFVHERTMTADVHIFGKLGRLDGNLSEAEYDIVRDWANTLEKDHAPDVTVFLDVDPEVCYERMAKRGRAGESSVSLEMLRRLHALHHEWYNSCDRKNIIRIEDNDEDAIVSIETYLRAMHGVHLTPTSNPATPQHLPMRCNATA